MQLVGLKGLHWTQTFPLAAPEVTIGREAGNTIVCDGDSRVSRRHARLTPDGLTYAIEDLGSANGTFVNGVQISARTPLNNGDEIRIGGQSYRFEAAAAIPTMAPPPPQAVPPRPREVSSAERAKDYTPGSERIYSGGGGLSSNPGCSMPSFNLPDLSGCLRILLLVILAIIILMVIGGLLMLLGSGIGALGGLGAGGHGGGGSTSAGSQGGGQQGGGGDQNGGQQEGEGIHVQSVRIAITWHAKIGADAPRALVTWDNFTKSAVHRIWATAVSRDATGAEIGRAENILIYDGKPVEAAGSHEDSTLANEGFDPPGKGKPAVVDVVVTKFE